MRNIYDQYVQPENRLTHALACTLHHDLGLLVPFLKWIGLESIPPLSSLAIAQQTVPGSYLPEDESDARGLPDMVVFDNEGWAVLFESKVQSGLSADQIKRHARTAKNSGYECATIVAITVDTPGAGPAKGFRHIEWRAVYSWFNQCASSSRFARHLVEYMRTFERQMIDRDYQIRGTITMFDGFHFDEETPYTYPEGKRLIRLLGDELQKRDDLRGLGVDPKGSRRSAITGRALEGVWDYLPLKVARDAANFTDFPHLTMAINRQRPTAAITIPNGVKGGFKGKLRAGGYDAFADVLVEVEKQMRPMLRLCPTATPFAYAVQRHYKSQRSAAIVDARLESDLRTLVPDGSGGVKHQPQWSESIYTLLTEKRSNIQFGVEVRFDYRCERVRSPECADLFARTWIACKPLIDFVLNR